MTAPRMAAQDWALLILLSLIWGGGFICAKIAVGAVPPLTVALCRVVLAALALHLVRLALQIAAPRDVGFWRDALIMGLLNNAIPFSLIFWGQKEIGAGLASILNATTPLFTVIVAHVFTADERAGPLKVAGVLAGMVGVAVMIGSDVVAGFGGHFWAEMAVLGAAFSYGFAGVFGRRFRDRPPLVVASGQLTGSSVLLLLPVLFRDRPWDLSLPGWPPMAAILALALFSTALAYVIFFRILKRAGSTNLSLVTLLIPPSALMLSVLFLGEELSRHHLIGMALIGFGLLLLDGRLFRLRRTA
ncbi:DMT family transporter [Dongia rigui]|uniref:DMT family transporter n=1 Tax=Dongia rigui TaxID=940149 RepID=A0ABU5E4K1_9PROT|nr:DMT family transporter [Dongia rigui]MDY0873843.1 DMT family transporter [Dongia rigui]